MLQAEILVQYGMRTKAVERLQRIQELFPREEERNEDLQKVRYWEMLSQLTDANVPDVPCTEKATFHCALMAAGHIGSVVRDIARGEAKSHRLVHNIPTHWLQTFSL